MAEIRLLSHEETIQALDARAKSSEGGDSFRLRIQRRATPATPPQIFALFEDACISHFATPETWLPRLVGQGAGGIFELMAYHASNPIMPVGGPIRIPIDGEQRPPNVEVVTTSGWDGPRRLSYPKPGENLAQGGFSIAPLPATGTGTGGVPAPRQPSAPEVPVPVSTHSVTTTAPAADPQQAARLVAVEEALNRKQKEIEQAEAKMRETAMRNEILGSVKTQMDSVVDLVRSTQQQNQAMLAKITDTPKDTGTKDMVVALAPLLLGFLQQSAQAREDAAKRQEAILMAMLNRPAIDPAMQAILDKLSTPKQDGGGAMLSQMSEAMASMTNVTMQLVHTAAEMGLGQSGPAPEPPWVKAVREGAKVVMAMMAANAEQAKAAAAQARWGANGAPPQLPAHHQPPPAVTAPPVTQPPPAATAPAPGAAPAPEAPPQEKRPAIEVIEGAIRKKAPIEKIALAIINNVQDPSIIEAFMQADGNIETLMRNRLGDWLNDAENAKYVEALVAAVNKLAQERGLTGDDGGDDGVEEEEEGDDE